MLPLVAAIRLTLSRYAMTLRDTVTDDDEDVDDTNMPR